MASRVGEGGGHGHSTIDILGHGVRNTMEWEFIVSISLEAFEIY